jgi:hypothetical protein
MQRCWDRHRCHRRSPPHGRTSKFPLSGWLYSFNDVIECSPQDRGSAMLISGRCHCGNILFALDWRPEPSEIPARACTCSFCAKHGGVWTSCPTGSLTVSVKDRTHASKYAFGTKTAEFHVCTGCGVVPVVTSRIDGCLYAVVSVTHLRM